MRGYAAIGLYNPKNALNIGGALRAAGCYGASMIAMGGSRPKNIKVAEDTLKAWRHIPLLCVDNLHDVIPYNCVPVAIEIVEGSRSLPEYTHPERAFYIFGPEDGSLPSNVLSFCRDIVSVPTKYCMNLAATVNVVLYDRLAKQCISGDNYVF